MSSFFKAAIFWGRFVFSAVTWLIYILVILLVPLLLGLFLVPLGALCLEPEVSPVIKNDDGTDRIIINPRWSWLWLWSNQEEGWLPLHYLNDHPTWSQFRAMYAWAAIRNYVDSLRFVGWLSPPQVGALVRWEQHGKMELVWQGWRARMIYHGDRRQYWLGWKYYPEAKDAEGWSRYGCGFTIKRIKNEDV